jgi:PAS domain S-box-containing protein
MSLHDHDRIRERLRTVADPVGFLVDLFVHAPVAFAVWTADGRPLLTNKAFIDLFLSEPPPEYNVLRDELLVASGMLALFERAFAGQTVHVPTFWYDPRDNTAITITEGRRVAISMTIFPLFGRDGAVEYVAATYKDETEIALANERLVTGEERQRLAAQVARLGIFEWNIRTGINTWTPEMEAMYGLAPGEFGETQRSWEDLVHPDDRDAALGHVNRAFETFLPTEGEWRALHRDGTVRWIVGRFRVLKDETGEPHRLIGVNIDITESRRDEDARRRDQAALRDSEARKAAVMEAALDAIVVMDHEGTITDFNPAAERTFGYARSEVVGRSLGEMLVPSSLRDRHHAGLARYRETGHGPILGKRMEVPALRKDGSEFPAEIAVVRTELAGAPVFTGYIRDITERLRAAEAEGLQRANDAAKQANAELEAFSYSVAHDLRAPLRAINGFSNIILEDWGPKLDPEVRGHLDWIIDGSNRMSDLIEALLNLARLTRVEPKRVRVDLGALAATVIDQLRLVDPERAVDFHADDNLVAQGDPELLRLVIANLLGNAWKFTSQRAPARIDFTRTDVDGLDVFHVRDNGAGFDMAHAANLFVPFRRLHAESEFEGTGIGLATVERIVRRHGGRVWAEGAKDAGAVVHFTLAAEPETDSPTFIV